MKRFSLQQLLLFTLIVWSIFTIISIIIPNSLVFHLLNPISIAMGVLLVIVYSSGLINLLKTGSNGASPAHLLTIGVALNWLGMIIRMARWFVTGEHPAVTSDIDYWFYNFGLWISIWAGMFLLGAANIAVKPIRISTMVTIFLLVCGFLLYWETNI